MDAVDERLARARAAHQGRDWRTAYELFDRLRQEVGLDADDLYALGEAAWWLGLIRETLAVSEECHRRFLAEGRAERAALVALEAGFHWTLRGQPEIGGGWVSRGRRLLEGLPLGPGHGFLTWLDASERAAAGETEQAVEEAHRLVELADELDEPVFASLGLALEGEVAVRGGDTERGFGLLDEAMLPVLAGSLPPDLAGNLYCQMMSLCHDLADTGRARRWTEVTERWCDGFVSAVMFVGICRVHRTQLLRLEGAWDESVRSSQLAADELAELNVRAVAEAKYELAEVHRLRGQWAEARAAYDAAEGLGRDPRPGAALLLLAEGNGRDAATGLRLGLVEAEEPFHRARLLHAQVAVGLATDDPDLVESAADELEAVARVYRTPGFRAWARSARGVRMLLSGDNDQALAELRASLACYQEMQATYDIAVTRLLVARALAASGDAPAADAESTEARSILARLGAVLPVGISTVTESPPELPGGLTPREHEILVAVAEGLSNRETAARLVISEKTVARHLANIYAKIGVPSRTAAVAWARREGLLSSA